MNQIVTGDCVKSIKRHFSNESIAMTMFSPPYDAVRQYNGEWTMDLPALGEALYERTVDGGVCAIVMMDGTNDRAKSLSTFRLAVDWCDRVGWRMFETLIYRRHGRPGAWWAKRPRVDHEYILVFFKGRTPRHFTKDHLVVDCKHAGKIYTGTSRRTDGLFDRIEPTQVKRTKCRGTIWEMGTSNSEGNRLKLEHPATYPDALARDLVKCFTVPGDLVVDPMCGSGTTCVVAQQEGRQFFGSDISKDYTSIARKRLKLEIAA